MSSFSIIARTHLSPLSKPPRVPLSRLESSSRRLRLLLSFPLLPRRRTLKSSREKKKKKHTTRRPSPRRIKRSSRRGFCRLSGGVYTSPTKTTKTTRIQVSPSTTKREERKRKGRRKGRTSVICVSVCVTRKSFSRQNLFDCCI